MILLNECASSDILVLAIVDAAILLCFSFPVIFFLLFKPLVKQIDKRKLAETILIKSEERYRNIFENIHDAYYETAIDGTIIEVSPSISYLSGGKLNRLDLIGTSVYELYANPSDREVLLSFLLKDGEVRDYEVNLRNRDGTITMCSVSARVSFDNNRKPLKITGSIRDITARKKIEEEIRQMNEQLRVSNSEKDKLFSIISHDLRSPLSTFIGLTEIMAENGNELQPSEMQKFSDSMHLSATNLYGLLENLLLWSRSRQDSLPFELINLPLLKTVREAVSGLFSTAEKKEIRIEYQINPELTVNADLHSFQTVIRNLASNAIKFTPRGGRVTLSALKREKDVEISISDTGIGMDNDMMTKMFRIDGKINRQGTEDEPSTGLGLILCKELIEKHGSRIVVSSEKNKGTRFSFSL